MRLFLISYIAVRKFFNQAWLHMPWLMGGGIWWLSCMIAMYLTSVSWAIVLITGFMLIGVGWFLFLHIKHS